MEASQLGGVLSVRILHTGQQTVWLMKTTAQTSSINTVTPACGIHKKPYTSGIQQRCRPLPTRSSDNLLVYLIDALLPLKEGTRRRIPSRRETNDESTLMQMSLSGKPAGAVCIRMFDESRIMQIPLVNVSSYVLRRAPSQVIHRQRSYRFR